LNKKYESGLNFEQLKDFLDEKWRQYNQYFFIETDPIQIPHSFQEERDIELAAFLTATLAWGRRDLIVRSAGRLLGLMDNQPYKFITNYSPKTDNKFLKGFVHRTFNEVDLECFVWALQRLLHSNHSLEQVFRTGIQHEDQNMKHSIGFFNASFFEQLPQKYERTKKHVANPLNGSSSKRLVMFLRWMVRKDEFGVDFGIWKDISPALLSCPLDVHTGNVGRKLGLIQRKQNDWLTVQELDVHLRRFDEKDPAKYDFALFGLGAFEGF
jgi:uncharacterized protein (TIGR02757 family)